MDIVKWLCCIIIAGLIVAFLIHFDLAVVAGLLAVAALAGWFFWRK